MAEATSSSKQSRLHIPRRLYKLYGLAALILIPWTIWLSYVLPADHRVKEWNIAWTGFDAGLIVAVALTAYFGLKKSGWVIVTASITGTFLLIDAWFDCMMARPGAQLDTSLITAFFFEIPIGLVSFWIAYETGRRYFEKV